MASTRAASKRLRRSGASSSQPPREDPPQETPIPPQLPEFIHTHAQDLHHNFYARKHIMTGRKVIFGDFADMGLENMFTTLHLANLMNIKENSYPSLMTVFFANLLYQNNGVQFSSRVRNIDVSMNLSQFASFLEMPDSGLNLHNQNLRIFDRYPEGHSIDTVSQVLHDGDFPDPRDENIHNWCLPAQVIAKIVMHNLLPKQGEYDRARGAVPLLTYCILVGLPVNIPVLIWEQIREANVATKVRGLPYGMLFTKLFKFWGIPFAGHSPIAAPKPIDYGFLHRKDAQHKSARAAQPDQAAQAPPPPPPPPPPVDPNDPHQIPEPDFSSSSSYTRFSDLVSDMTSRFERTVNTRFDNIEARFDSFTTSFQDYQRQQDINLSHFAAAQRYQHQMYSNMYQSYGLDYPAMTAHSHPLPYDGPPFTPWVDYPNPPPPPPGDLNIDDFHVEGGDE